MSEMALVGIERVISSVYRDLRPKTQLEESDLVEWAGEALEQIGAYTQYTEAVEYITVADYRALIPCGLHKIVRLAYKYTPGDPCGCAFKITSSDSTSSTCTCTTCGGCDTTDPCADLETTSESVLVTQTKQLIDYHLTYRFSRTSSYFKEWKPMRLATSNYAKAKTAHCANCINLSNTCDAEYSVDHPYIKTSFQNGHICLAYIKQPLDDRNLPLIPDQVSYIEAIKRYLIMKISYSDFIKGAIHPNIFAKLEDDWHWYCAQARNKANMPDNIDKLQNMVDRHVRLIPYRSGYYGFFGNVNNAEQLRFGNE